MATSTICAACRTIPFDRLPAEEQPAFPHHASLKDLAASASESGSNCPLCLLILLAIGDICASIKNGNPDASPGIWMLFTPNVRLPSGQSRMLYVENGNYISGGGSIVTGDGPGYNGPMYFNPLEMFPDEQALGLRPWLFGNWWRAEDSNLPPQLIGIGVRLSTTANIEDAVGNSDETVRFRGSLIRVRAQDHSPLAGIVPGRLRTANTASVTAFTRCLRWLHRCDAEHRCAPPSNSPLPTRVLDIEVLGNSAQVKLVEILQQFNESLLSRPYAAVSHCWGTSHRIVTQRNNLEAHRQGINVAELPATFQHAVEVTRLLGMRYLWIDSLCIVQDDPQDWEREAAKMGDVYANAHVTIAVDSSTDDSSGCYTTLNERKDIPFVSMDNQSLGRLSLANAALLDATPPDSTSPILVGIGNSAIVTYPQRYYLYFSQEWMPSSLSAGLQQLDHPRVYKIGEFGLRFDPIDRENLSKRGWTLQERLIAPRTLHFTKAQIFWECQECMLAEDGAIFPRAFPGWATVMGFSNPHGPQPNANSRQFNPPGPLWLHKNIRIPHSHVDGWLGEIWLHLVERYSARSLTYDKDKLPALSGLARLIASAFNDVYHAGLWRRHIIFGLHWRLYVYEPHHFCDSPEHDHQIARVSPPTRDVARVPEAYRAPSWSWASVDGRVEFEFLNTGSLVASVVHCHTPAAGDDRFGQLALGCYIKLLAPVVKVIRGVSRTSPGNANHPAFRVPIEIADHQYDYNHEGGAYFDTEPQLPCEALFLDNEHALLVKKLLDGTYERIGIGTLWRFNSAQIPPSRIIVV